MDVEPPFAAHFIGTTMISNANSKIENNGIHIYKFEKSKAKMYEEFDIEDFSEKCENWM